MKSFLELWLCIFLPTIVLMLWSYWTLEGILINAIGERKGDAILREKPGRMIYSKMIVQKYIIQVKDSEIALEALKEMNGILKKASKQPSNTATLKWACEMDEDIFTIQIHLEKRKAFVDSINRTGEGI